MERQEIPNFQTVLPRIFLMSETPLAIDYLILNLTASAVFVYLGPDL